MDNEFEAHPLGELKGEFWTKTLSFLNDFKGGNPMFENFTFPLITLLSTGNVVYDNAFNFFFSLMVAIGFLLLIPAAIIRLFEESI